MSGIIKRLESRSMGKGCHAIVEQGLGIGLITVTLLALPCVGSVHAQDDQKVKLMLVAVYE